jgi:hypothetical protein
VEFCSLSDEQKDAADVRTQLEHRDLRRTLFPALRQAAGRSARLKRVLDAWERVFLDDDRIASGGQDRTAVHEVRLLAREELQRLACELEAEKPTGRELL